MRTPEEQEEVNAMLRFVVAQERQADAMERQAVASEALVVVTTRSTEIAERMQKQMEDLE